MAHPLAQDVTVSGPDTIEKNITDSSTSIPRGRQVADFRLSFETPIELVEQPTPYTIFTAHQKLFLIWILGLSTLASPLTATIYLPLLPLLQIQFRTSAQAINLTITLYIVFQALSPAIFATLSDSLGRRVISLITYTLYTAASLGLALNKSNYAVLLILRALQAFGASACIAIAYGVIADVSVPSERGRMLSPVMVATNLGTCIGPVIGGWVTFSSGGYQWVFWALVIFGGGMTVLIGAGMPETARSVVGNGSKEPGAWYEYSWWILIRRSQEKEKEKEKEKREESPEDPALKRKVALPNPLACLRIIFYRDTALILWLAGSFYANWYCVQASIPHIYSSIYHWNDLEVGLAYLPGAFGVTAGGYINGKLLDWKYKKTAEEIGHKIDVISGDDLTHFPIERARARSSWYLLVIYTASLAGFGWAIESRVHPSIALILQTAIGFTGTCFFLTFNALLVDIFPQSPSTAAASGNITRCALSAIWIAILTPLSNAIDYGWYFTLWAFVVGFGVAGAVWALEQWGMGWRALRLEELKNKSRPDIESRGDIQANTQVK